MLAEEGVDIDFNLFYLSSAVLSHWCNMSNYVDVNSAL